MMNLQLRLGNIHGWQRNFIVMVTFHDFHPPVALNDYLESVSQRKKRWSVLSSAEKPAKSSKLQKLVLFFVLFFCRKVKKKLSFQMWSHVNLKWWKVCFTKCHAIWENVRTVQDSAYLFFSFFLFSIVFS